MYILVLSYSILDSYKSLAGLPATKAMNLFLKEAASLPSYGTESFTGKLDTSSLHGHNQHPNEASNVMIRIGPFGLEIVEEKTEEIHRYMPTYQIITAVVPLLRVGAKCTFRSHR